MCRLLESICLSEGEFRNLHYHEARITRSAKTLLRKPLTWKLQNVLAQMNFPKTGLFKTRFVYDAEFLNVEFVPYQIKAIKSLKLIEADIEYDYKYENREVLNTLFQKRGNCDDIIMVRDGFITDTSYANLIFKKQNEWFTPATFLLEGTMRTFLLDQQKIGVAQIRPEDLNQFEACKLINAMLGIDGPEIPISVIS